VKVDALVLTPDGEPPSRGARWCPSCHVWIESAELRGRRRCWCGTAVVRPAFVSKLKAGELRPGIVAEFADPRDRYDPTRVLTELRARLTRRNEGGVDG
jgi:hypothetical protein